MTHLPPPRRNGPDQVTVALADALLTARRRTAELLNQPPAADQRIDQVTAHLRDQLASWGVDLSDPAQAKAVMAVAILSDQQALCTGSVEEALGTLNAAALSAARHTTATAGVAHG